MPIYGQTSPRHFLLKIYYCCAFDVVNDTHAMSEFLFYAHLRPKLM